MRAVADIMALTLTLTLTLILPLTLTLTAQANGSLEVLRLSGNADIGGGACVRLVKALQASV